MKILIAEYASALGLGGTCELEGRAMLATLASSFERAGHEVLYPTSGPVVGAGRPILMKGEEEFKGVLDGKADAGLLIAPDGLQSHLLEILEKNTANLGASPDAARLCADKLLCTSALVQAGVPVAEIVDRPDPVEKGCHRYVVKPRTGCGSEGVRVTSFARAGPGEIVTRYHEGLHLSTREARCPTTRLAPMRFGLKRERQLPPWPSPAMRESTLCWGSDQWPWM
jgi:predicted ATP-grasp superfamily ATP-dependent carboligase